MPRTGGNGDRRKRILETNPFAKTISRVSEGTVIGQRVESLETDPGIAMFYKYFTQ